MKRPLVKALAGAMLLFSHYSLALSSDTEQPIYIQSESQHLDMATNTVTFTQDVVLTQGSIKILADKLVVIRPQGQEGDETIEAFGKPATFEQTMDDGKKLHGEAYKLRYEVGNEFLKMSTNAMLEQAGNQVEGNVITYQIDKQQLVAESDSNKRVTTILQPTTKSPSESESQ